MASKNALVVIDVQNIYFESESPLFCPKASKALVNINLLIAHFAKNKENIFYFRHVHSSDNSDLGRMFDFAGESEEPNFIEGTSDVDYRKDLIIPSDGKHFIKNRYSCLSNKEFESHLRAQGIDNLVICGFMTNYCCESTARAAHDQDYYVDFIMDATGCPDASDEIRQEKIKKVVGATLEGGFARVLSTAKYLEND